MGICTFKSLCMYAYIHGKLYIFLKTLLAVHMAKGIRRSVDHHSLSLPSSCIYGEFPQGNKTLAVLLPNVTEMSCRFTCREDSSCSADPSAS